jgi:hypothetical protein
MCATLCPSNRKEGFQMPSVFLMFDAEDDEVVASGAGSGRAAPSRGRKGAKKAPGRKGAKKAAGRKAPAKKAAKKKAAAKVVAKKRRRR